jgi:nucleoid-associated protein YgaU
MTTVRIGYAIPSATSRPGPNDPPSDHPDTVPHTFSKGKMVLRPLGSQSSLVIPFAPREVTYSNGARVWTEVTRDGGRAPLLINSATGLKKIAFQLMVTQLDYDHEVTAVLNVLRNLSKKKTPIMIGWSSWEVGHWRITGLSFQSVLRHPSSNEITRATVDLEFTLASDAKAKLGPTSGGKGGDSDQESDDDSKKMPTWYTTKEGDTVMKIAMKFYHKQEAWRIIAKLNDIDDPHKELKVGRKIRLHK